MTDAALTVGNIAHLQERVKERLQELLDSLQITEFEYRQYEHGMPLTVHLLQRALKVAPPPASVLVVAPHAFLIHALLAFGYQPDVLSLGGYIMPEDLEGHVKATIAPGKLTELDVPGDRRYALALLPFALESTASDIRDVLTCLRSRLQPSGKVILVNSNLAKFGTRWRALSGKPFLPDWNGGPRSRDGGWPMLPHYRYYNISELTTYARETGYQVLNAACVRGYHAFNEMIPLSIKKYMFLKAKVWIQRFVPSLRDEIVLSLEVLRDETAAYTSERDGVRNALAGTSTQVEAVQTSAADTSRFPLVSVVLPTKNRGRMLANSLRSLFTQSYPKGRYEIVVVNDGSTDDTAEVIAQLQAEAPCVMKVKTTPGLGTPGARNLGMREAVGEIVAHTDDDNELPATWLESAVSCFDPGVAIVSGPIVANPKQRKSFFGWSLLHVREDGTYPTSNIFYRRDVALSSGGFNENLRRNRLGRPEWGWDTDLAWRIKRQGYQSRYSLDAYAFNEVFELGLWRWLAEPWRAYMLPGVLRIAPEVRRTLLLWRLFFSRNTFLFDVGVIGAILSIWLGPLAWLLAAPWTIGMVLGLKGDIWPPYRLAKLVTKLLLLVAAHCILLAALLWGGLKARRLIL